MEQLITIYSLQNKLDNLKMIIRMNNKFNNQFKTITVKSRNGNNIMVVKVPGDVERIKSILIDNFKKAIKQEHYSEEEDESYYYSYYETDYKKIVDEIASINKVTCDGTITKILCSNGIEIVFHGARNDNILTFTVKSKDKHIDLNKVLEFTVS